MTKTEIAQTAKTQAIERIKEKDQLGLFDKLKIEQYEKEISELVEKEKFEKNIIEIPRIIIVPVVTKAWFEDFDLDTRFLNIQPLSDEIIRKTLREQTSDTIYGAGTYVNDRLDNIIVNELINIPEVDYYSCSKLLFKLVNQVIEKCRTYQPDEKVKNIVQFQKKEIANFIKPQLMEHLKKEVSRYEVPDVRAFVRRLIKIQLPVRNYLILLNSTFGFLLFNSPLNFTLK